MGGMIAQTLAIEHPERVLSLASIMFDDGRPGGRPPDRPRGCARSRHHRLADREGYVETTVRLRAMIGSPGFPRDDEYAREVAARCFDRGYHPDGSAPPGDRDHRVRAIAPNGCASSTCRPS